MRTAQPDLTALTNFAFLQALAESMSAEAPVYGEKTAPGKFFVDLEFESGKLLVIADVYWENGELTLGSMSECHMYLYTHNNPVMFVDPSGEVTLTSSALVNAAITMLLPSLSSAIFTARLIIGTMVGTAIQFYFANHYFPSLLVSQASLSLAPNLSFSERVALEEIYDQTVVAYRNMTVKNMVTGLKSQLGIGILGILTVKSAYDAISFISSLNQSISKFLPGVACGAIDMELAAFNLVLRVAKPERLFYAAENYKRAAANNDSRGMFAAQLQAQHEASKYCKN